VILDFCSFFRACAASSSRKFCWLATRFRWRISRVFEKTRALGTGEGARFCSDSPICLRESRKACRRWHVYMFAFMCLCVHIYLHICVCECVCVCVYKSIRRWRVSANPVSLSSRLLEKKNLLTNTDITYVYTYNTYIYIQRGREREERRRAHAHRNDVQHTHSVGEGGRVRESEGGAH
jgi:hypothetical protein